MQGLSSTRAPPLELPHAYALLAVEEREAGQGVSVYKASTTLS